MEAYEPGQPEKSGAGAWTLGEQSMLILLQNLIWMSILDRNVKFNTRRHAVMSNVKIFTA